MNGLIVVNKEKNMTSFDVVREIRKIFHTKKVGHLGTLDPLAKGVLVITINEGTKLAQFIENVDKTYIATIVIGKSTTTYDLEGEITCYKKVDYIEKDKIIDALHHFQGKGLQTPPLYSAIKKNGKKLYEYARNGEDVKIEPREVEIKTIKMIGEPIFRNNECEFQFETTVSKGTYIRSLCCDIAQHLGYPGYMKDLIRTQSGEFTIDCSSTIEEIKNGDICFHTMLDALKDYPMIDDEFIACKAKKGMMIGIANVSKYLNQLEDYIAIKRNEELIAIYKFCGTCYKAVRVWN